MTSRVEHRHRRHGLGAVVDATRRELLNMLAAPADRPTWDPERPPTARQLRRREWHTITCALGDLAEDIASLLLVALALVVGAGLITAVLLWIGSWWVYAAFVAATAGFIAWLVWRRRTVKTLSTVDEGGGA